MNRRALIRGFLGLAGASALGLGRLLDMDRRPLLPELPTLRGLMGREGMTSAMVDPLTKGKAEIEMRRIHKAIADACKEMPPRGQRPVFLVREGSPAWEELYG